MSAVRRLGVLVACVLAGIGLAAYLWQANAWFSLRVAQQIEVTGHPFVLSDLFPRWYGARALLEGRDPFSDQVTQDMQRLYYGAPMAPEREAELFGTTVAFFYPPFVVLPLLPLLWLPFEVVRWLAVGGLAAAVAAGACIWCDLIGFARSVRSRALVLLCVLAFRPTLDVLWLQQLTGLVFLYLVGGYVAAARRWYWLAGVLFALALIKPQTAALPAAGVVFWSMWRRERWLMPITFVLTTLVQLAVSEHLRPGWLEAFAGATEDYRAYNVTGYWLPGMLAGSAPVALALVVAPLLAYTAWLWWRVRCDAPDSPAMTMLFGMTMAVGVTVMPDIAFYNKTLLIIPLLSLAGAHRLPGLLPRATTRVLWITLVAPVVLTAIVVLFPSTVAVLVAPVHSALSFNSILVLPLLVVVATAIRMRSLGCPPLETPRRLEHLPRALAAAYPATDA